MVIVKYDDLVQLLGVDRNTLSHAVSRGILTKLPKQGNVQPFIKEQALLFKGKKRLSLASLNESELNEWNRYAQEAQGSTISSQTKNAQAQESAINPDMLIGAALAGAALAGATIKSGVPQGNPFQALVTLLKSTQSRAG